MSLDDLDRVVVHHIVNSLGWPDLRPLQHAAIGPLTSGSDVLLLAPTAGGKTEAAMFPLLSRMVAERWQGTSLLYLCPLKALLNNLAPRLANYAGWVGRRAAVWHGDIGRSVRQRILVDRPDILLTTPESLEAMLVSNHVDHATFFASVQAVVVDEVHAFAGDDRGWHLLAVLERLTRLVGRPIQRVGLSATVGNPDDLLTWLQGAGRGTRPAVVIAGPAMVVAGPAVVVAPDRHGRSADRPAAVPVVPPPGDVEVDYVGSLANAAKVIAALHAGDKRLVFCESRKTVEELGELLRVLDITTFLSHASLSAAERHRSEQAFAEARDCVIVSTSTLELGIDVGDLDRVIQIDTPATVASFLQRLGRTGRRADAARNCLFLTLSGEALVKAAGLLLLWGSGWVEPVTAPPEPRHIVAQQILALCLQQHRVGDRIWSDEWNGLEPFGPGAAPIVSYLVEHGFLDTDGGMMFIGPAAELRFGYRHFMDMTAVFTGPPEFTVVHGRAELGSIDPSLLTEEVRGDRRILLGGHSWRVTYIDWRRRRCFVEPADSGGRARWMNLGWAGTSFELTRAMRDVLLGTDPSVTLTKRAVVQLQRVRDERRGFVHPGGNVVVRDDETDDVRWWTWAGFRANATLVATLDGLVDPMQRFDDQSIRLRTDLTRDMWRAGAAGASTRLCLPDVDDNALVGLKFSDALPKRLAVATVAARMANLSAAAHVLSEPTRFVR
jgi:ATP-dependent Lhr-like helicase